MAGSGIRDGRGETQAPQPLALRPPSADRRPPAIRHDKGRRDGGRWERSACDWIPHSGTAARHAARLRFRPSARSLVRPFIFSSRAAIRAWQLDTTDCQRPAGHLALLRFRMLRAPAAAPSKAAPSVSLARHGLHALSQSPHRPIRSHHSICHDPAMRVGQSGRSWAPARIGCAGRPKRRANKPRRR